jgi:hypothetical protein
MRLLCCLPFVLIVNGAFASPKLIQCIGDSVKVVNYPFFYDAKSSKITGVESSLPSRASINFIMLDGSWAFAEMGFLRYDSNGTLFEEKIPGMDMKLMGLRYFDKFRDIYSVTRLPLDVSFMGLYREGSPRNAQLEVEPIFSVSDLNLITEPPPSFRAQLNISAWNGLKRFHLHYVYDLLCESISTEKQKDARQILSQSELPSPANDNIHAAAAFPNLENLLKTVGLYGSDGSHIAGVDTRSLGARVALTAVVLQSTRLIITALSRNPVLAAVIVPSSNSAGLTVDVNVIGLPGLRVQQFFSASPATQRKLCGEKGDYKSLCEVLSDLETSILYANGQAT